MGVRITDKDGGLGNRLKWGWGSQTNTGGGGTNSQTQVERRLSRGLQTKMGVGVID